MAEALEGWYTDPYGRHEARWMSDGAATKLVRDDGIEFYEDPRNETPSQVAKKIVEETDCPRRCTSQNVLVTAVGNVKP